MSEPRAGDDLIVVAQIAKTRGLRGEVVADLLTDFQIVLRTLESLIGITRRTGSKIFAN